MKSKALNEKVESRWTAKSFWKIEVPLWGFFETNISLRKPPLSSASFDCLEGAVCEPSGCDHNKDLRLLLSLENVHSNTSKNHSPWKGILTEQDLALKGNLRAVFFLPTSPFLNHKILKHCYMLTCPSPNSYIKVHPPVLQMWPHSEIGSWRV